MLYDLLDEPPEPGSVLEALCLLIQKRREVTELHKTFALLQAIRTPPEETGDAVVEAYRRYRDSLMPFLEEESGREQKELIQALREEIARSPTMSVHSLLPQRTASQLRKKLEAKPIRKPQWQRKRRW